VFDHHGLVYADGAVSSDSSQAGAIRIGDGADRPGGAALARLETIDDGALSVRLRGATIELACDVDNPLVGPNGASAIYGPQKGATPGVVRELDAALSHFADVVSRTNGVDVRHVPGGGAAGGIAAGFLSLAGARLVPGAELVLGVIGFEQRLEGASLVVTGEGKLDRQTLAGKAPYAVANGAWERGIPVAAVAGSVDLRADDRERMNVAAAEALDAGGITLDEAMRRAPELTDDAAERAARSIVNVLGRAQLG